MDKEGNDPPGSVEEGEEVMDDDSDEEDRSKDDENTIQVSLSKKARKSHIDTCVDPDELRIQCRAYI